ncbi:MAG: glycosyltransferase family 2 protein [Rhodoferax sp.]|nr:glycosyltransferase family 2 protein [Rhodoferax sp.]
MISIITAIYNQLSVNKIYWNSLKKYTKNAFELIIIDNGSNDGSREFFQSIGAKVISNSGNYAYPHCQNQGIAVARHEWLCFLNNDIVVAPNWDNAMLSSMQHNGLEVATCCGIEQVENAQATRTNKRRWQRIKNLLGLFGYNPRTLTWMHRWMYGDWEAFSGQRSNDFRHQIKEGFVGNTVVMHRPALAKIGLWDERIQAADFDLYLRTKARALTVGDIKPVHICLDVFNHHYIRLTAKGGYPRFADFDQLVALEAKWSSSELAWLDQLNS